jgi:aquaporin Z
MIENLKVHWQTYLMELFGLAGFVLAAGLLTIFLEHPDLPVMKSSLKDHPLLRRIPLGIILGIYIAVVVLLFGKKSGAHINPSVTWTFYRLGKISFTNALFYTIAQFAGAIGAAQLLKYASGDLFSHPLINYGVTEPKPPYESITAFIAEFIISAILMLVVLMASSSKRLEKYVALMSGVLIAVYLIIEIPFSGMSLNPARSFAGAFAANKWEHLWIYFVAPTLAMLAAGEVFIRWKKKQLGLANQDHHHVKIKSIRRDYNEIPHYPTKNAI